MSVVKKQNENIWKRSGVLEWFHLEHGRVHKARYLKSGLKQCNLNVFPIFFKFNN